MSARSGAVEKNMAPFDTISGMVFYGSNTNSKSCQTFVYFSGWANGPYSPGLGSCAGVIYQLFPKAQCTFANAVQLPRTKKQRVLFARTSRTDVFVFPRNP